VIGGFRSEGREKVRDRTLKTAGMRHPAAYAKCQLESGRVIPQLFSGMQQLSQLYKSAGAHDSESNV
jgi:hypothetical protein